jgi:hypothetical protein
VLIDPAHHLCYGDFGFIFFAREPMKRGFDASASNRGVRPLVRAGWNDSM